MSLRIADSLNERFDPIFMLFPVESISLWLPWTRNTVLYNWQLHIKKESLSLLNSSSAS